jgi:hypothetical protein
MPNRIIEKLTGAVTAAQNRIAPDGPFTPLQVAQAAIETMQRDWPEWTAIRDAIVTHAVTVVARRSISRAIQAADSRQGWLALPEYSQVPSLIEVAAGTVIDIHEATLEQYRAARDLIQSRIKDYDYPRRALAKLKSDKQTVAQMKKLDRRVAGYFANAPAMRMGLAIEMYAASLETGASKRIKKATEVRAKRLRRINKITV